MEIDEDGTTAEVMEGGSELAFDFWSDEGARIFNEALDEGSAYMRTHPGSCYDFEEPLDDDRCEYIDPDFCDPDAEDLTPGEMELIFENCFQ